LTDLTHISFDLDETLFDFRRTLQEALSATSRFLESEAGCQISPQVLQDTRDALAQTSQGRAMKLLELRKASLENVLQDHPDKTRLVKGAMQAFETARFGNVYLYPEAQTVLSALSETYTLVAVTNGNTNPEGTDLAGLFETIIFAEDCGIHKPDPRIFEVMMKRLGLNTPKAVLHVGDHLINDIHCAAAAGCATVWFNPGHAPNTTQTTPTYEIRALTELLQLDVLRASG